jgi:hypothetical protein
MRATKLNKLRKKPLFHRSPKRQRIPEGRDNTKTPKECNFYLFGSENKKYLMILAEQVYEYFFSIERVRKSE